MFRLIIAFAACALIGKSLCAQELVPPSILSSEELEGDGKTLREQTIDSLRTKYAPEDPNAEWCWHESQANIAAYFIQSPARYEIRMIRKERKGYGFKVQIFDGEKLTYEWESNSKEAFLFAGTTLIYTEHHTTIPGCTLIAIDLKKRKQIWTNSLTGLSKIGNRVWSGYHNQVALKLREEIVVVYGNELHGQYVETVDIETGKTVTNTIGKRHKNRF